jgi:hypothetical protein
MAVSAGIFEGVVALGRFSREYVKCASFTDVGEMVVNRFAFSTLIFDGPSVPFAEVP